MKGTLWLLGHSQKRQTKQLQSEFQQGFQRQTLHQPGVQEAAGIQCPKGSWPTERLSEQALFLESCGKDEQEGGGMLQRQNRPHLLHKVFVLVLRSWLLSQRWCNLKEQGLRQREVFTAYADGKSAKELWWKHARANPNTAASLPHSYPTQPFGRGRNPTFHVIILWLGTMEREELQFYSNIL